MNDKKSLFICLCLFICSLLLGLCCYNIMLMFNNDSNNIVDIGDKNGIDTDVNNNDSYNGEDDNLAQITLNNNKYLWKMKVNNLDGAYVYDTGYVECIDSVCERGEIISKLEYGIELNVIGDFVFQGVLSDDKINYDKFKFDDIENYYSILISYNSLDGENKIGYIKYSDVLLIDANNFNSNEYEFSKKYYVSSDNVYLYDGPGLLYESNDEKKLSKGDLLEVKYYNQVFSRNWLYVSNDKYDGWVMQCRYNTVNEPYSIVINNCVDEIVEKNGDLEINQDGVILYEDTDGNNKLTEITKGSLINYNYMIYEPGVVKFYVSYNNFNGFIIGLESSSGSCVNNENSDGKLIIIMNDDGSINTCN